MLSKEIKRNWPTFRVSNGYKHLSSIAFLAFCLFSCLVVVVVVCLFLLLLFFLPFIVLLLLLLMMMMKMMFQHSCRGF